MAELDGEKRVIATAHRIIRSLGGNTDALADDMMRILSNFDGRFSHMAADSVPSGDGDGDGDGQEEQESLAIDARNPNNGDLQALAFDARNSSYGELQAILDDAEAIVFRWDFASSEESHLSWIWQDRPDEILPYLHAVDSVLHIVERLSMAPANARDAITLDRAQNVLQLAMFRLEEELRSLLEKHSESVDPEWLFDPVSGPSFASNNDDASESSGPEDEGEGIRNEIAISRPIAEFNFIIDMLPPEIVASLVEIASQMVVAGYKTECCQVYISIRKTSLEESLYRLGLEKVSIEDVQKMQWETLETEITKWIQAMKIAVGVLFSSEKQLCDQVFMSGVPVSEYCFAELARGAMMQLLHFGEAVAISRRSPERLFKILDMYETLRDLLPKIESIFSGAASANLRVEAWGIVTRLGEAARGTFAEFENAVQRETSKNPVPGGAVHPLTRYVMNYMRFLSDYTDTLNQLLGDKRNDSQMASDNGNRSISASSDESVPQESPLSNQIVSFMQLLENNLDGKSKMYRDSALSYLFMMNNCNYILQKVKDSEVRTLLGDDWLRRQTGKVRQNHNGYQRAAWVKVLNCLKDEGIHVSGSFSSGVSRTVLKERFRNFNAAFEEILKTQSSWVVSDPKLCTELRISIAEMLLPAYRSFLGRFRNYLDGEKHPEKYLKYTPEELEFYLNNLFEGTSGSMNKRKSSSSS